MTSPQQLNILIAKFALQKWGCSTGVYQWVNLAEGTGTDNVSNDKCNNRTCVCVWEREKVKEREDAVKMLRLVFVCPPQVPERFSSADIMSVLSKAWGSVSDCGITVPNTCTWTSHQLWEGTKDETLFKGKPAQAETGSVDSRLRCRMLMFF